MLTLRVAALVAFAAAPFPGAGSVERPTLDGQERPDKAPAHIGTRPIPVKVWALRRFEGVPIARSKLESATFVLGYEHLVGGSAGCNPFIGDKIGWAEGANPDRGTFTVHQNKGLYWTLVKCQGSGAMDVGGRFWSAMNKAKEWSVSKDVLTIKFRDGSFALLEPTVSSQR